MRKRIGAPGRTQPRLAPLHDRVGLGMQRNTFSGARHRLEGFEHRAGGGRGNLAEGIAHVALEADHACRQRRHMLDRVLAEQAVEAEVHMCFLGRHLVLGGEDIGCAGRRNRIRHVEHGGDAAERCCRRAAREVFLVRIAGVAEMHVHVDRAGQHMHA